MTAELFDKYSGYFGNGNGCPLMNRENFYKAIAEACKDMEIISVSTFEVVDIDDQIEQAEIRGYNNALRNLRKRFSPSPLDEK